jgi:hypothetical protein
VSTAKALTTAAITATILATGAACQPSTTDPTPSPSTTNTPPVTTSPSTPAAEAEALAAYRGMWGAFVEAAKTSNPDAPEIRRYAYSNALTLIVNALYVNRDQKEVILGELVLDPKVTAAEPAGDPTEVTITDCVNSEKWLEYRTSGGLVDDKPGGKHNTTATVTKTAEGWQVKAFILREAGTC